ncbi:tetratricopeptide repeat protein [Pseudoxanthomonas daejeonensis]|uniref:tetratricopeptide repeat protein n=1 Tax=Pseudoxanthomonas daejeonensis TaxID=266062 RepID=UPI001F540245|nr:tetratricopeptide repeat protein [Pseudoxanthomonas daejeonensis]UNK56212.1 tetratricopeptide repeat protein [Pseudoxanthomonas daejeonensis]
MKPGNDPNAPGDGGGNGRYRFDGIVVDAAAHTLVRDGREQALEPKAFAVLLALLQRPGDLLGRDALLDQVWGHRHVTPGVLTRAIAQLRAALDDDSQHPRYIQTQHALGYRFVGVLETQASVPAAATEADATGSLAAAVASAAEVTAPPIPAVAHSVDAIVEPPAAHADAAHAPARMSWVAVLVAVGVLGGASWWWRDRGQSAAPLEASIAVLPFTTLSEAREDRFFAEGLSVEMLNALAGVRGVKVAAWRPPEAIDRGQDIKALGRLLGVASVLDASVRRDGRRLRINARLSDTRTGYTLWSRNYDGDADTIFDTQTDIANAVAGALVEMLPEERESLQRRLAPTRNAAAFDAYLFGLKQMIHPQGEDARKDAAEQFRKALAADAGFAKAQAGLCRTEAWNFESNRDVDAFESARLACLRASNMDRTMGEVSLAMGDLYRVQGDAAQALKYYDAIVDDPAMRWQALVGRAQVRVDQGREEDAMRDFRQALLASPGNAQVHAELGYQQFRLGHYPEAIASYRTALSLRPDDAWYWSIYGGLLLTAGDNEAAEVALRRSLALEPNEPSLSNLGTLRYQKGDYAGAAELYRRAIELNPTDFFYVGFLADALEADPRTAAQAPATYAQAAALAQRFVDAKGDDAKALAALGWYRAQLGERDSALRLAQQAQALGHEPGDVAMFNAQALAVLGELDQARVALQAARKAGIPASRIDTQAALRRTGLATPPGAAAPTPPDPATPEAPPRGT